MTPSYYTPDPALDLVLERVVPVPPDRVWRAWTEPALLKEWFCPRPWRTAECDVDLRPGGVFRVVMQSPEGESAPPNLACYLEVVPNQRLVWTVSLGPGYRPAQLPDGVPNFTAIITMEPVEGGTKYTAIAMHRDPEGAASHNAIGFHDGWGTALDQLVEVAQAM
jgi:uncharacterized protein YndB with AHSA1/START domain